MLERSEMQKTEDIIVDDSYLMEKLNLTKGFINSHARAMGSFSRPRRFFLKNVMAHLEYLANRSMEKAGRKTIDLARKRMEVNEMFELVMAKRNGRRRKGKGKRDLIDFDRRLTGRKVKSI
jgi:hypothetical protein